MRRLEDPAHRDYRADIAQPLNGSPRFRRVDELRDSVSFENTRAMPLAWLVGEARQLTTTEMLRAIHESQFPDGQPVDPWRQVLLEKPCPMAPMGPAQRATLPRLARHGRAANRPSCVGQTLP